MREREHQRGFTIMEALATVAIMVIFLAISIVAAVSYQSKLKITELDNEARQIYLAAQNRAVLLHSRGALEPLLASGGKVQTVDETGAAIEYRYITNAGADDPALDQFLPVGTIDPTLREGQFYIVYEPASGSVTDAFYTEEALDRDFAELYKSGAIRASADVRRKEDPMVGWYSAEAAVAGDASYLAAPEINIINEDTLRAEITWTLPEGLNESNTSLQVTVIYGSKEASEEAINGRRISNGHTGAGGTSYKSVYLLDSLVSDLRFKDLFPGTALGGDFTIRAQVVYDGTDTVSYIPQASEKTANSLFADGTTGDTAHIAYLRHLQNLDPDFSGVSSAINKAVQDKDIDKPSGDTGYIIDGATGYSPDPDEPYNFCPIDNSNLNFYDGDEKEIRWLHSAGSSYAGLFFGFTGSLTDIRLMNADISGSGYVGALCGDAKDVAIDGCQVYWNTVFDDTGTAVAANLQELLGKADKTYALSPAYKIQGGTAGGLVGSAEDVTITKSFASTTVSGTTAAGGLVGQGKELTITSSYADCYLKGGNAAGLVGSLSGTGNKFTNVYTAGFVSMDTGVSAAGLYLGGTATVTSSYAAMAYSTNENVSPLSDNAGDSFGDDVYYLGSLTSPNGGKAFTTAKDLSSLSADFMEAPKTYAYNLRPDVALFQYPYPGLKDLDHYGDWPVASRQNYELVYWEQYTDNTIGVWGSTIGRWLQDGDALVKTDGYALLLDESAFTGGKVTVNYTLDDYKDTYPKKQVDYQKDNLLPCTVDGKPYYLAELPAGYINDSTFYGGFARLHKLYVAIGDADPVTCWFDPHFAKAPIEGPDAPADDGPASVRSARHLYNLSRFANMYSGRTFVQELNIDYSDDDYGNGKYIPPEGVDFGELSPIGNFVSTYDGGYHYIWPDMDKPLTESTEAMGLFGYNHGTIQNLFFGGKDSGHVVNITGSTKYLGALVGQNNGTIINCAVGYVTLESTSTASDASVGGLVGQASGTITNCSASTDRITATSGRVGGFAGDSNAIISSCYAISRIDAGTDVDTAAGFAVQNNVNISNSYAAADLNGGKTQYAFSRACGDKCYYLDKGEYLNETFNAPGNIGMGELKTWDELTNNDSPLLGGFSFLSGDPHVLPAIVVKDDLGTPFHYGNTVFQASDAAPVGVYYWEYESGVSNKGYHFRVVGCDPVSGEHSEYSELFDDLCTDHDDGGVITEYGYGWFLSPTLNGWNMSKSKPEGLAYNGLGNTWYNTDQRTDVSAELAERTGLGAADFRSFQTAGSDGQNGLYLTGNVNGKFTISKTGNINDTQKAVFELNPFFANAINYDDSGNNNPSGLGQESHPYEIRSIRQLQFINWNTQKKNCTTHVESGNGDQFPYLGSDFVFQQTHDLDGGSTVNFFPISAWRDTGSIINTAFAGTYDGQSYVIKNISISADEKNTVGLFGATLNAKLRNIILYSEKGDNELTITNEGITAGSGWYYAGTLVGLAIQNSNGAEITNCASAGFTIKDETTNHGLYGGNIGGLVGASNAPLSNCTAVNNITLDYRRSTSDQEDIRVGGLAGACAGSITSCYSGGTVDVSDICNNDHDTTRSHSVVSLYIGRISGGVDISGISTEDIKNYFGLPTSGDLSITNCYSYVTLPKISATINGVNLFSDENRYRELYNIAGDGEIPRSLTKHITVRNAYYLGQSTTGWAVDPHDNDCSGALLGRTGITEYSYDNMTTSLFTGLPDFKHVDANSSCSTDPNQTGNYPFPAVLTRTIDGAIQHIHYGEWPYPSTASANSVMAVDLFADYDDRTGTAYQDNLVWPSQNLAAQMPGGQFRPDLTRVVSADGDENAEPVCEAFFVDESDAYPTLEAGQRVLRVTFLRPGDAEVTVYYGQPEADIDDCVALTIPVTDTAELHMQPADTNVPDGGLDGQATAYGITPENVTAFAGASTKLDLYPFDRNNEPIAPALKDKLSVTLNNLGYDSVSLTAAGPIMDAYPDTEDASAAITLDSAAATNGVQTMTVDYSFTVEGVSSTLTGSDNIQYEVKNLTVEPEPIVFVRRNGAFLPGAVTYGAKDVRFTVNGEAVTVDDLRVTNAVSSSGAVTFALNEDGSATVAPGSAGGGYALDQTQMVLTFTYGPASHSVTVYPLACFYEDGMTLHLSGDAMNDDGSIDLYAGGAAAIAALSDELFNVEPVSVEMTDAPDMTAVVSDTPDTLSIAPAAPEDDTAAPAPGVGTPVRVVEYMEEDWSVQWSLDSALAPYVSLAVDGSTAWLNVTGLPEVNVTEGVLTVTVTLPEPWLGVTFTGSVPVRLINENAPASTPEPTPVPEVTPVPEYTAPPAEEITPAPPVQEPEWQPEWDPEPVPDAPDAPDFLDEFIP